MHIINCKEKQFCPECYAQVLHYWEYCRSCKAKLTQDNRKSFEELRAELLEHKR